VLWFGALVSALAPTIEVLIFGRLFGGFAAGMAYPTTLALTGALWGPGPHAFDRTVGGDWRRNARCHFVQNSRCESLKDKLEPD